jgi:hypothetical protein
VGTLILLYFTLSMSRADSSSGGGGGSGGSDARWNASRLERGGVWPDLRISRSAKIYKNTVVQAYRRKGCGAAGLSHGWI